MDTALPLAASPSASPSVSPAELAALLGRPGAPLLLDVRRAPRFAESPWLLPGACHVAPGDVAAFARSRPPADAVVYCVYGHDVSADAVRTLRGAGWNARLLAGGIEGGEDGVDTASDIQVWREPPLPRIRKRADLGVTGESPSRWITRARPKIDRVACPWLILRWIDPGAAFFYVPQAEVGGEAARLAAVPFDIEGAPITHQWEKCSFDALIAAFELRDPALDTLARIVRGADTSRTEIAPQSAGLLAVSLGLSHLHAGDDQAMLRAALPVYDALYAWCRHAQGERHSWLAHAAGPQ